jgi:polo-like kinase 1
LAPGGEKFSATNPEANPGWSAPADGKRPGAIDDKGDPNRPNTVNPTQRVKGPDVWVKKWVDYSSKYGLGYLLSNKATGVFFNDSTKIVLDPGAHHFDYYERRSSDKKDVGKEHTLTDYPKELAKKVTLLQHFRSYLESGERRDDL